MSKTILYHEWWPKKILDFSITYFILEELSGFTETFLVSLYEKCVLSNANIRYISPRPLVGFLTHSHESLAHFQSVTLGERGFVLLYAKPLTPIMCSSHLWCQINDK